MELFKVSDVSLKREGRIILDIASLSIKQGNLNILVGDNGAGKTTLLRLLSRQVEDYSGSIWFDGTDIRLIDRVAYTRRVHYVFQHPRFLQGSVLRNLLQPLAWRASLGDEERKKAEALLQQFGLAKLSAQPATSLSGGEAQRLSLARAMLLDPDVLLVDEPTANVDEENARLIAEILRSVVQAGKGVVVATHDPLLVRQDGHILRLLRGRVS